MFKSVLFYESNVSVLCKKLPETHTLTQIPNSFSYFKYQQERVRCLLKKWSFNWGNGIGRLARMCATTTHYAELNYKHTKQDTIYKVLSLVVGGREAANSKNIAHPRLDKAYYQ